MGTIPTTYAYSDTATLVPASHNDNIYDITGTDRGIMSEANGGLEAANLASAFRLRREHVQVGGCVAIAAEVTDDINEYVCEYIGETDSTRFIAVAGCVCRAYIPFTPHTTRFVVQSFVIPGAIAAWTTAVGLTYAYETRLAVFVNGTRYNHSNALLATPSDLESTTASFSSGRPVGVGTSPNWVSHAITLVGGVTSGFNEVSLRIYLQQPGVATNVAFNTPLGSYTTPATRFSRVGFGFRSAYFIAKS